MIDDLLSCMGRPECLCRLLSIPSYILHVKTEKQPPSEMVLLLYNEITTAGWTQTALYLYRVRQEYVAIWQHSCEWNCWRGEFVFERPSSETQSVSVPMERWSVEHWAFAVETYLKNNDSVVLTQRIFRRHFNIRRNDSIPSRNIVLLWVWNFRETASVAKRNPPGRQPSLRTPENIERVRQAFVRNPRPSASKMPLH